MDHRIIEPCQIWYFVRMNQDVPYTDKTHSDVDSCSNKRKVVTYKFPS